MTTVSPTLTSSSTVSWKLSPASCVLLFTSLATASLIGVSDFRLSGSFFSGSTTSSTGISSTAATAAVVGVAASESTEAGVDMSAAMAVPTTRLFMKFPIFAPVDTGQQL